MSHTEQVPFIDTYTIAADPRIGVATSPASQVGDDRLFVIVQATNPLDIESARAFAKGVRVFIEDHRYERFQTELTNATLEAFYADAAEAGRKAMYRDEEDILDPSQDGVSFLLAHLTPVGLALAWVGNCSAAWIRDGKALKQTTPHTLHAELRAMNQEILSTTPNSLMRSVKPTDQQAAAIEMLVWDGFEPIDEIILGNRNLMEQEDISTGFANLLLHHQDTTELPLAAGIRLANVGALAPVATTVAASTTLIASTDSTTTSVAAQESTVTPSKAKPEKKSRNFWLWLLFGGLLCVLLYFLFFRPFATESLTPSETFKARLQNELLGANTLNERIVAYRLALERADEDVDQSLLNQAENEYENLLQERKSEEARVIQLSEQLDGLQLQQQDVIRKINEVDSRYRDADRGRTISTGDKRDRFIKTMEDLVPVRQDYAIDSMRIAREVTRTKEELYSTRENLGLKVDVERPVPSRPEPAPIEDVQPTDPTPAEADPKPQPKPEPIPESKPEPKPEPAPTAQITPDKKWAAREGIHVIIKDGKYGFMDTNGKVLYSPQLQSAGSFANGRARVKRDGKWGFMTKSMKLIVPYKYSDALNFGTICNGYAKVIKGGAVVYIDTNGKEFEQKPCN